MWESTVDNFGGKTPLVDKVFSIKEETIVAEATRIMKENNIGSLLVFDKDDKFAGIVTERDMISKVIANNLNPNSTEIRQIMTPDPICIDKKTNFSSAENLMEKHKIRHLPILDDGKPVGMVSSRDVVKFSLNTNKKMKMAAKQLSILTMGLSKLKFEEVISLAIIEIPKSFGARKAFLCLAGKDSDTAEIFTQNSLAIENTIRNKELFEEVISNNKILFGNMTSYCRNIGIDEEKSGILIPLKIYVDLDKCKIESNLTDTGFLCITDISEDFNEPKNLTFHKASMIQSVLNINLTNAKICEDYKKMKKESQIDPITKVGNRKYLEDTLETEFSRASRYNNSFSVAIIDIDDFKGINDEYGHAFGDKVLYHLCRNLQNSVRKSDIVARYGGDELVVIFPETTLDKAISVLERFRLLLKKSKFDNTVKFTFSAGITEISKDFPDSPKFMLKRADKALYIAKNNGRDQIVPYDNQCSKP